MVTRSRRVALLAVAVLACSSYRSAVREGCLPLFGSACRDAYGEYFERDPEGARAAYRAHVRRLATSCEGVRRVAKPQDIEEVPEEAAAPAEGAGESRSSSQFSPEQRERCAIVAALRAHATLAPELRERGVPAGSDPDALPADWEGALGMLRALCPRGDEGGAACDLRARFEAAERGEQEREYWFNGPVREVVLGALLDRRERLPAEDVEGRRALLSRVTAMIERFEIPPPDGPSRERVALLARLASLRAQGDDDQSAPGAPRAARDVEDGRRHAELSARHLAAGRPGLAWLHGGVARALGAAVEGDAEAVLAAIFPAPALVVRADAAGCPWAMPAPLVAPAGAPVAEVSLRWTRCASDERRWETREARSVTRSVERTRQVQRQVAVQGGCGVLERNCVNGPVSYQTVTEEVTETAPAELTVNVTVRRRELATGASAEATIRVGDRTIFASWSHSAPTRTEAQSPGSERFSETTLDDQRGAVRDSLTEWLGERGGGRRAIASDTARRLVEEATARREGAPDAADELYARALFLARTAVVLPEPDRFAERQGITPERLRASLR